MAKAKRTRTNPFGEATSGFTMSDYYALDQGQQAKIREILTGSTTGTGIGGDMGAETPLAALMPTLTPTMLKMAGVGLTPKAPLAPPAPVGPIAGAPPPETALPPPTPAVLPPQGAPTNVLPPQALPPMLPQPTPPMAPPAPVDLFGGGAPGVTPPAGGGMAPPNMAAPGPTQGQTGIPPWLAFLFSQPGFGMGGGPGGGPSPFMGGGAPSVGGGGMGGPQFDPAQILMSLLSGPAGGPSQGMGPTGTPGAAGIQGATGGAGARAGEATAPALQGAQGGGLAELLRSLNAGGGNTLGRFGSTFAGMAQFPFAPFLRSGGGFASSNPFAGMGLAGGGGGLGGGLMGGSSLQDPKQLDMRRLLMDSLFGGGMGGGGGGGLNVG